VKRCMIRSLVTISCGVALLLLTLAPRTTFSQSPSTKSPQSFQELFDYSLKEKKGLTFFVQGQTIPGVVTKMLGDDAIEVRNQTSNRIIIRLDRIDAVVAN
jgi:hypothetical protein